MYIIRQVSHHCHTVVSSRLKCMSHPQNSENLIPHNNRDALILCLLLSRRKKKSICIAINKEIHVVVSFISLACMYSDALIRKMNSLARLSGTS